MNSLFSNAVGLIIMRLGLVALFLWFGISQVLHPDQWTAWIPAWTSQLPLTQIQIIYANGGFEILFGLLLFLGLWTRFVAALLALHLFFIAFEVGYNDIGVRDFALGMCTLAMAIFGPDKYSLSRKMPQAVPPPKPLF